tara:strand:- start:1287 stop:2072 length:786 start_codon:yes stop_codon:yes gene_type:complete
LKYLSSPNNQELKRLRLLFEKSKERKKQGLFVIEGLREIEKAVLGGYKLKTIFIQEGSESSFSEILKKLNAELIFCIEKSVFDRTSIRSGSEKIIAIANTKTHTLEHLNHSNNGIILVVEAPEKPGNIGAIYRTAAAAKINSIIIANPKTDFYNPNSIRSSLGSVFLVPTALATSFEVISYLKNKFYRILTATIETNALSYLECSFKKPCAIIMGAESSGLSSPWIAATDQNLIIPMHESVDSLNLSVSAGILMYEAQSRK